MADSRQIGHTSNYTYRIADRIGSGAFSLVYKGYHKRSGVTCALKIQKNQQASVELERESIALTSLSHPNIVNLLDIENESGSNKTVFVMEFCSGGSLLTLLDEPKNHRGLHDGDIILLLVNIASALRYLNSVGFVHRDIKPGNILVSPDQKGRHVFKLSDFGSSKYLQESNEYESLTGTEEYLHPLVYEKAFIDRAVTGKFTSATDRWSVGATIAHAVLGEVPFKPFEGARQNRKEMFTMISRKPSKAIGGKQDIPNGPIHYQEEFPENCNISMGLRPKLLTCIRGLLRTDSRQWTYETLHHEAQSISSLIPIHVLITEQLNITTFYASKEQTIQDFIRTACNSLSTDILVYIYGEPIEDTVSTTSSITKLPESSVDNPVIILSSASAKWKFNSLQTPLYAESMSPAEERKTYKKYIMLAYDNFITISLFCNLSTIIPNLFKNIRKNLQKSSEIYGNNLNHLKEVFNSDIDRLDMYIRFDVKDISAVKFIEGRTNEAKSDKNWFIQALRRTSSFYTEFRKSVDDLCIDFYRNIADAKECKRQAEHCFKDVQKLSTTLRHRISSVSGGAEKLIRQSERNQLTSLINFVQKEWSSSFSPKIKDFVNRTNDWLQVYERCRCNQEHLSKSYKETENVQRKISEHLLFFSLYSNKDSPKSNKRNLNLSRNDITCDVIKAHKSSAKRLMDLIATVEDLLHPIDEAEIAIDSVATKVQKETDFHIDETSLFG